MDVVRVHVRNGAIAAGHHVTTYGRNYWIDYVETSPGDWYYLYSDWEMSSCNGEVDDRYAACTGRRTAWLDLDTLSLFFYDPTKKLFETKLWGLTTNT